jgi:hypothetical protein
MRIPEVRALGTIALVVLGAWCVVNASTSLASFLPLLLSSPHPSQPGWYLPPFVVYATCGAMLIGLRERIASALFTPSTGSIDISDAEELQSFLLALLGIWIMVDALVQGAYVEVKLNTDFSTVSADALGGDRIAFLLRADAWLERIPYFVRFAAGMVLFSAAGNVVRAWQRGRRVGTRTDEG